MEKHTETAAPEGLLDQKAAAAYLGCKEQTLACWRVMKIGPRWVKIGRLVRYAKADLDAYILLKTQQTHNPLPKAG